MATINYIPVENSTPGSAFLAQLYKGIIVIWKGEESYDFTPDQWSYILVTDIRLEGFAGICLNRANPHVSGERDFANRYANYHILAPGESITLRNSQP